MKLFNSAGLIDTVDSFLHVGYMSAYPRQLEPGAYPPGSNEFSQLPSQQIDLTQAFRLSDNVENTQGLLDASAGLTAGLPHSGLWFSVLAFAGTVALLYLVLRRFTVGSPYRSFSASAAAMFAVISIFTFYCNDDNSLPVDKPWEGMSLKAYENPELATRAILFGIIAPAAANIGQTVTTTANIQNEVALPVKNPNEGMRYALDTYGIDGWGNEFQFVVDSEKSDKQDYTIYTVTSSGPDETFNTEDDISATFNQTVNGSWGYSPPNAFFLVSNNDNIEVLFHRWKNKMFEYHDKEAAKKISDSTLFDVLPRSYLSETQIQEIEKAYNAAKSDLSDSPVLLQVFI